MLASTWETITISAEEIINKLSWSKDYMYWRKKLSKKVCRARC